MKILPFFLILILSFFQACKKENAIYNRTMDESQEERVIGIQGVISKIEIITEEYKKGKNTKINHYYTLKIRLNTGHQLTAYEDSSKKRIADIPELNSIYEKEEFSELPFEKASPLIEKLKEFRQFKTGDRIIIRIPYWSIAKYLKKESDSIRIYLLEKSD
jgi:hypothetical protein